MNLVHLKGIGITNEHVFLLFCSEYTLCTCSCTVGKKTHTIQYGYRKCGTHE